MKADGGECVTAAGCGRPGGGGLRAREGAPHVYGDPSRLLLDFNIVPALSGLLKSKASIYLCAFHPFLSVGNRFI